MSPILCFYHSTTNSNLLTHPPPSLPAPPATSIHTMSDEPEEMATEVEETNYFNDDLDDSDFMEVAEAIELAATTNQHSSPLQRQQYFSTTGPAASSPTPGVGKPTDIGEDEYPCPELDGECPPELAECEANNPSSTSSPHDPPADSALQQGSLLTPLSTLSHYTRRFPALVLPRSAVSGLSARVTIRTVFRLSQVPPPPRDTDMLVELYARVVGARHDAGRVLFALTDLFTDAAELRAVYEGVGRCELWDTDAAEFLKPPPAAAEGAGRIARAVGRVRKGGDAAGLAAGVDAAGVYFKMCVVWEVDMQEVAAIRALLEG